MGLLGNLRDRVIGSIAGWQLGAASLETVSEALDNAALPASTKEALGGLGEIELAEEDINWRELVAGQGRMDFSRASLRKMTNRSRVMYLVNPLIHRAVSIQELYVWGSGVSIKGDDASVDEVVQAFFTDQRNQTVIGESWDEREREQRIDGNTFLVFFVNKSNGTARVRLLPFHQVERIIFNPEDATEPWYYVREPSPGVSVMMDGGIDPGQQSFDPVLYPDIDYDPIIKPSEIDGRKVHWDTRVMHIKTGGLSGMTFGMPELFSAMNWSTAYTRVLENFAKMLAAYARYAMKITGTAGKKGIAAAKSKLGPTVPAEGAPDPRRSSATANWFVGSGMTDIAPIKTAGSTTAPDEARAIRSMVAAGSDTPEHFFGDSDIGNFATSSTLDRPTELKMVSRQRMWMLVILRISMKLMEWSAKAPTGVLRKAGFTLQLVRDDFDKRWSVKITPPANRSLKVTVAFPSILERDVTDRVRAVVQAATLGGSPAEGIIPDRGFLFKLLMIALGEKDATALMEKYYPEKVTQGFIDPADRHSDDHLAALGKKELGDAALIAAKNKPNGKAPASGSPAPAVSNK